MSAPTMPDTKHINDIVFDGEKYPVNVRPVAVEQLPHLERDGGVFRSELATPGRFRESSDSCFESRKPPQSGFTGMLRQKPFENCVCVLFGGRRDFNAEGHASRVALQGIPKRGGFDLPLHPHRRAAQLPRFRYTPAVPIPDNLPIPRPKRRQHLARVVGHIHPVAPFVRESGEPCPCPQRRGSRPLCQCRRAVFSVVIVLLAILTGLPGVFHQSIRI